MAGVRRFGSAALDLAWVAAGRVDGYWERDLKSWDVAAGVLLVTEAGGKVSAVDGEALDSAQPHHLRRQSGAASPALWPDQGRGLTP